MKTSIVLLIALVAALLRFYALDASSLWSDEGNTWALIQRSFGEIARDAAADIHPPGYYWLLKVWTLATGTHAWALRAFSAVCGVLVVVTVYLTARRMETAPRGSELPPLLAAWIVLWNPLQIYYSQEARMYMPLTLAGVGLFGALMAYTRQERMAATSGAQGRRGLAAAAFWVCGVAGLWLHYSFPIVLIAAGLTYLWHWWQLFRSRGKPAWPELVRFALLAAAIVVTFLPWLPTALRQILTWPQGNRSVSLAQGLELTLATLLHGPTVNALPAQGIWLALAAFLPLLGLWMRTRQARQHDLPNPAPAILFWLGTPIAMMFGLGLFSDAFLKFLLVASPAWAIAVAWSVQGAWRGLPPRWAARAHIGGAGVMAGGVGLLAWLTLPAYYTNPTARDNYAGIARYVTVHGATSAAPLVLLNAPGQGDIWRYYDPGIPVAGLPAQRPPDPQTTEAELRQLAQHHDRIFALYWATAESDPQSLVENWLDQNAFPGLESWQGNVRFVDYSVPNRLTCTELAAAETFTLPPTDPPPTEQTAIALARLCTDMPADQHTAEPAPAAAHTLAAHTVTAGDVLLLALGWETVSPAPSSLPPLAVTLQLLDARNQVVAQRDAPLPNLPAQDRHGIPVPVGTPPGDYRLILALYDPATGARLQTDAGDALPLGTVTIARAPVTADPLIDAQHPTHRGLGPVTLLGYDLHRKDFSHAPTTPVHPGDPVQLTLYWQAPDPLPPNWPDDLHFDLALGEARISAPLAGGDYPTGQWQPGEVVRARFEGVYTGGDRRPHLQVAGDRVRLLPLP